jgi:3-phenylpropionate/trans-cinnamate dioxygenase ferredoxin reductase subunit
MTSSPAGDVVIVGAGLAGVRVAEGLRERGFDGSIVLVGAETDPPYDRPPLSKHVLRGEREPFLLLTPERVAELSVDLRLGVTATGVSTGDRRLETTAGPLHYAELVIASGAEPRRLPDAPGLVLRTLQDSIRLREQLRPGTRLGIVGAGLIGCEVAASASARGAEVHVVDVLAGPLIRVLGSEVSRRVRDLHESRGVTFHLGSGVLAATPSSLSLSDGTFLELDVVLEAMGVMPTTAWLADSGLPVRDGVLCDEVGQVIEGVWAVGDVARWSDGQGGTVRHEHWTSASDQGGVVAAAILGDRAPLTTPPYWWSDQYDLKLAGLGHTSETVELVETGPRQRTVAVYSENERVTGVVGFSAGAAVMKLRDAISEGAPVADVLAALA